MEHKKTWYEKTQSFLRHVAESNKASMIMYGTGTLFLVIIIFQAGMLVGTRQITYLKVNTEPYPVVKQLPTVHGTTGIIVSITLPNIIVADEDNTEKIIFVKDTTIIRGVNGTITPADLQIGDTIIVIGTPNTQGKIQANLIRVLSRD